MNEGAKYHRCDFQVHSPRDLQFTGKACVTEEDRKEYSKNFILACREKDIEAVAITDHHDLSFYRYIKEASETEQDGEGNPISEPHRIIVFPGLELTLDVPCQALLIFDATLEINDELIVKIYTALSIQNQAPTNESKTGPVTRLPFKSINAIYDKLNSINLLMGRFTVLPNVKEDGRDSILRTGFHNEYANGLFVGGYLDRGQYESHKSKIGWNNIVNGKTDAYGNRSIGIFQTSDNRIDTFEHLGVSRSWVKWSVPTAEALRQACIAKKSRILQEEPKLPLTRISVITISGSTFLKNIQIEFNPQFNVLIGGRGTGKSSLLQYISWVLGKDSEIEKKAELDKFIKNTLSGGSVEVTVVKNSIAHIIHRTNDEYKLKIGEDDWQETNSENIVSIIRSDSFAQKELSKHEKNRTTQLTKIIENSVDSGVESIKRQLSENASKIKEVAASFESYLANRTSERDLKNQIDSIEEQIKSLNIQLNDVPDGDKEIIRDHSVVAKEKNLIKNSALQINSLSAHITTILNKGNFNEIPFEEGEAKNKEEIKQLVSAHNKVIKSIQLALEEALNKASSISLDGNKSALEKLHMDHDAAYVQASARQIKFEKIITEIEALRKRLTILMDDHQRVKENIGKLRGTIKKLQKLFFERNHLNLILNGLIKNAAVNVASKSEGSLEIKVTSSGNIEHIIQKFTATVTSSKGQPERTSAFFKGLIKGNNTYKQLLKFWLSLYRSSWTKVNIEETIKKYGLNNDTLLDTDFERIGDSLNSQQTVELALGLPTYELKLDYCKDHLNKIPFEDASYGQQAGSILTILLNQEFGPLLIDQPEDDLDNKVIHQITENIISAKHKRQLIFSSHNANIAVNGDAELILTFDHISDKSAGEIICKGSIDKHEIKTHVKEIMEGGKKAFEMRKIKYGF